MSEQFERGIEVLRKHLQKQKRERHRQHVYLSNENYNAAQYVLTHALDSKTGDGVVGVVCWHPVCDACGKNPIEDYDVSSWNVRETAIDERENMQKLDDGRRVCFDCWTYCKCTECKSSDKLYKVIGTDQADCQSAPTTDNEE